MFSANKNHCKTMQPKGITFVSTANIQANSNPVSNHGSHANLFAMVVPSSHKFSNERAYAKLETFQQ